MRLRLGPVPSSGVRAWVAYASRVLDLIDRLAPELPFQVPPDVVADFRHYLDEWGAAARNDPFVWEGEPEAFRVRLLMTYWLNVAKVLADRAQVDGPQMPEESGPFYEMLVEAILGALAEEDETAERLQKAWPFEA